MSAEKTKIIDGKVVLVMKRKLLDKVLLKTKLLNLLGGSFLETLEPLFKSLGVDMANGNTAESNLNQNIQIKDIDLSKFVPAVSHIFSSLDGEQLISLMKNLLNGVFVDERDISTEEGLEAVVGEDMILLYKIIAFVVYAHFSSFFLNLTTTPLFQQTKKMTEKTEKSLKSATKDSTKN